VSVTKTNGNRQTIDSFTKSLPVRLTLDEVLQKSADLAGTVQDYATEESRQADIKAQLRAKLTELDAKRTQLAIVVARKEEYRDVRCEVVADVETLLANITRTDTGEIVQSRPLTDSERQKALPL
jgi:hypothetical protein